MGLPFLSPDTEPDAAEASDESVAAPALDEVEPSDDKDVYISELKAKVNELDGAKTHFQRELGSALKELAALQAVQGENTELQAKVGEQASQIAALEESLRVADTKIARADEVIAAGKAIKQGLADLG